LSRSSLPATHGQAATSAAARSRPARRRRGDRLFVSAEGADYLDRLRELGVSQRTVLMERDGWILMQSVLPEEAAIWIVEKRDAIGDPEFRAIYLEYDAASDWSGDDPRLYALADRSVRWLANWQSGLRCRTRPVLDSTIARLVATSVGVWPAAWNRLTKIARELRSRAGN
jgi:hypothetical protein